MHPWYYNMAHEVFIAGGVPDFSPHIVGFASTDDMYPSFMAMPDLGTFSQRRNVVLAADTGNTVPFSAQPVL